jgi:hypothetical protein
VEREWWDPAAAAQGLGPEGTARVHGSEEGSSSLLMKLGWVAAAYSPSVRT